jgi:hypothetical protein
VNEWQPIVVLVGSSRNTYLAVVDFDGEDVFGEALCNSFILGFLVF